MKEFCFDESELKPIYNQFATSTGKMDIVRKLIEYADQRELLDLIMTWAKAQYPFKFERYRPYQSTVPPNTVPDEHSYHSWFISYSHKDEAFADRLHADLTAQGVKCWYAPQDIRIGDKIRPTIDRSVQELDRLLLVLSKNSIDSDWVEAEFETVTEKENKFDQPILFPIRLDESIMETDQVWASFIRHTRHIGDFSQWEDREAYQKAFERLLRDLEIREP